MTASRVKEALRRSVGMPEELWGRSIGDPRETQEP